MIGLRHSGRWQAPAVVLPGGPEDKRVQSRVSIWRLLVMLYVFHDSGKIESNYSKLGIQTDKQQD